MVETIQTNMDRKLFSCGVFIDLKKAFDTVNHTVLLDKLNYYGFRGIVNQWFSSYLSNRTQSTEIGSHISSKLNINCGVPQGSVLGPLLFLLYINDIQYCSSKLQFFLFADGSNALYADKDLRANVCNFRESATSSPGLFPQKRDMKLGTWKQCQ